MRDQRDYAEPTRDAGYRDMYDDRRPGNYDSHYDEGEDPVAFVNVIDMDIPFFQLVWLIFKILLATIVAAGILSLLISLLIWVLDLPAIRDILPDGMSWFRNLTGA
jgi:hypothetical protein